MDKTKSDLAKIELLVLDVDGVLTDGKLIINADGTETKAFNSLDGHGIRLWKRAGLKVAFLSGRFSVPTDLRAKQLDIDYCFQDCHHKLAVLKKLLEESGMKYEQTAYVGDDLQDMPPIRMVGFGVAVANAVEEVKKQADYVTAATGGNGAVREVIEHILKASNRWQNVMQRYLQND